ncbi:MAG TPA: hypothetical protein VKR56_10995, partial [Candidatus Cybelea sp.]|nr:hypothetical protein [Candidatus Cybelea sp.]
ESRQFYAHNENFEPFFRSIPSSTPDLERDDRGRIKYSFANLLHLKRPVVIVDEAHNARTTLTFESLRRMNPASIIEFTATPDRDSKTGSNVLYSVSAKELRDAEMIKLPIVLTEHRTWEDAVHAAIAERDKLAEISRAGGDVIRPIVLLQAQNKDREVTVSRLLDHMRDNEGIDRDRIAVATGDQRELDGIDLFAPTCKVDHIITVAALREGWDCSYAYVLCSVADLRSATAVEQLLGRVLRMPFAKRRAEPALNKAYAHVVSQNFIEAAESLQDKLVNRMGFEAEDFFEAIEPGDPDLFGGGLFDSAKTPRPFVVELPSQPNLVLPDDDATKISYETTDQGKCLVTVMGPLTNDLKAGILAAAPQGDRARIESQIRIFESIFQRPKSPAELGQQLVLPRLAVRVDGAYEIAEPQLFLDHAQWNLFEYPAIIPGFHYDSNAQTWIYDFFAGADGKETLAYKLANNQGEDLLLPGVYAGWNEADLIRWLDGKVRDQSTPQFVMLEWLRKLIKHLTVEQRFSLETLVKAKFILTPAIRRYIEDCKKRSVARGYQEMIFGPSAAPKTDFDYAFSFADDYDPKYVYSGSYRFKRHFYPQVGELKSEGEELLCAKVIDGLQEIDYWVRNLERRPLSSFWLPTSTDRFYPDFVCRLLDERLLVVEYKGEVYKTNDDSAEKKRIGELWARSSNGRCLFLMAVKDDEGRDMTKQLQDTIRGKR